MSEPMILDTSGLHCPVPMLKTKKALKQLQVGEMLKVITTDPASEKDIQSLLAITHDRLVSLTKKEASFVFVIEKTVC